MKPYDLQSVSSNKGKILVHEERTTGTSNASPNSSSFRNESNAGVEGHRKISNSVEDLVHNRKNEHFKFTHADPKAYFGTKCKENIHKGNASSEENWKSRWSVMNNKLPYLFRAFSKKRKMQPTHSTSTCTEIESIDTMQSQTNKSIIVPSRSSLPPVSTIKSVSSADFLVSILCEDLSDQSEGSTTTSDGETLFEVYGASNNDCRSSISSISCTSFDVDSILSFADESTSFSMLGQEGDINQSSDSLLSFGEQSILSCCSDAQNSSQCRLFISSVQSKTACAGDVLHLISDDDTAGTDLNSSSGILRRNDRIENATHFLQEIRANLPPKNLEEKIMKIPSDSSHQNNPAIVEVQVDQLPIQTPSHDPARTSLRGEEFVIRLVPFLGQKVSVY